MWRITVAGSIGFDDVTTPLGHRTDQQGGSAIYFGLAASRYAPVGLVGVIGHDGIASLRETIAGTAISSDDVEISELPTYRWHAVHDFQAWVATDEQSSFGAYATWEPKLGPHTTGAEVLFVGSMDPDLQLKILANAPEARLIGIDSMVVFIDAKRDAVIEAISHADVLFLNLQELSVLLQCEERSWELSAAAFLSNQQRLQALVIKGGPEGAVLVTSAGATPYAAARVGTVVDPTGAGDALAGGFLGWCAHIGSRDAAEYQRAMHEGLTCAADAISSFGVASLKGSRTPVAIAGAGGDEFDREH